MTERRGPERRKSIAQTLMERLIYEELARTGAMPSEADILALYRDRLEATEGKRRKAGAVW